jgi:hypothetical protein
MPKVIAHRHTAANLPSQIAYDEHHLRLMTTKSDLI